VKLPAFQFYVGDWKKDIGVQSLSFHDRGVWLELVMLMHESEQRGKLILNGRGMPDEMIARAIGLDIQTLKQTLDTILTTGVGSRDDKTGALICRRMVRDENLRQIRPKAGKLGGNPALLKQNPTSPDKQDSTPSSSLSASSTKPPCSAREPIADDDITADMVAQAVLQECALSGMHTRLALEGVVRAMSTRPGYSPDATREMLIAAWRRYEQMKPKLRIIWSAEKFFGDGHWRTPDAWPRKEEGQKGPFDPCAPHELQADKLDAVSGIRAGDIAQWRDKRARGEELPAQINFYLDRKKRISDVNDTTKTA
jgi:hypothetical protein